MFDQIEKPLSSVVSYFKNLDTSENAVNRRLGYTLGALTLIGILTLGGIGYEMSKQNPGFFYSGQTASELVSSDEARVAPKNDLELNVKDEQ